MYVKDYKRLLEKFARGMTPERKNDGDKKTAPSYRSNGSSGVVRILKDLDESIEGKEVIIVEDIVATGLTLSYLVRFLKARNPASLKICTLLDRAVSRIIDVPISYTGFELPDVFIVGYGLDFQQHYRNLPFICTLKPGNPR